MAMSTMSSKHSVSLGTMEYDALREAADNLKIAAGLGCNCLGGVNLDIFIQALEAKCDELDKAGVVQHEE